MKQVLTIAGSDSGGGAGIQADIKAMSANGVFAMSAITAITAQNTEEVTDVFELPLSIIAAQIDAVFDDFGHLVYPIRHLVANVFLKVIETIHGLPRKLLDVLLGPNAALCIYKKSNGRSRNYTRKQKTYGWFHIDLSHIEFLT